MASTPAERGSGIIVNPLLVLANEAATWHRRPMSPTLENHARRALVDWMPAMLPGARQPPATLLAAGRGQGRAICYADGHMGAVRRAALLNGVATHTVEFDDIHRDSGYHPGSPTIAAALAVAQDRGEDMPTLLRAVVAGYEVSCRSSSFHCVNLKPA